MSKYRDDSNDTAVARDSVWIGLKAITEGTAKITETVLFGLLVLHADAAVAADQVIDRPAHMLTDQARVIDAASDHLHARLLIAESIAIGERITSTLRVMHGDSAGATDVVVDRVRGLAVDGARVGEEVLASRRVRTLVTDTARAGDSTGQATAVLVVDTATIGEDATGRLRARALLVDTAALADEVTDGHQAVAPLLIDTARVAAVVVDRLAARDLVSDLALIEDASVGGDQSSGQAWTANVDSWAMSRYAPYTFTSLAVIDGRLYGLAPDGVYALDGGEEPVSGALVTGKIDLSKGTLVHPVAAYLEYELDADGTAVMDVTTTQSGVQADTYSYPLEREPAAVLTNGRFKFGRGLRGRHFSFALRLTGKYAYINDLRVESAPTKRGV